MVCETGVYEGMRSTVCTRGGVYDGRCSWSTLSIGCCLGGLKTEGSDASVAHDPSIP